LAIWPRQPQPIGEASPPNAKILCFPQP
jgi:hypothetical protein